MDVLSSFVMKIEFLFAIIETKKPELYILFVFAFVFVLFFVFVFVSNL